MLESEVERIFGEEVKRLGGLSWKWTSPGISGVPDRIVMLPGHAAFFVEFKTESGKLSALQKAQHERMTKAGTRPIVIRGLRDVRRFFMVLGYQEAADRIGAKYAV